MKKQKTIRHKLLIAVIVLAAVIGALGYSSFRGAYAYRDLAVILSQRASEFPVTDELTRAIDELQHRFDRTQQNTPSDNPSSILEKYDLYADHRRFRDQLFRVQESLSHYRIQLTSFVTYDPLLSDRSEEVEMVGEIEKLLAQVSNRNERNVLILKPEESDLQRMDLQRLSDLAHQLPTFLYDRMRTFRDEVRTRYRTWILISWSSLVFSFVLLAGLCVYAKLAVIAPFKALLQGSRRVASGDFVHRIEIDSQDELSELGAAINMGTESFLRIQRSLHDQVLERSREVIRNEQLASVGFLAAGVAHEINNPLASIAWSAEALESRLHNILHSIAVTEKQPGESRSEDLEAPVKQEVPVKQESATDIDTLRKYLRRIQDEAFRCKGITERLLDFSRLGQSQKKQQVDLVEIVSSVIDMVRHLGQYRNRRIEYHPAGEAIIWASSQEIKQVVLNLLTNALDSISEENALGIVQIETVADRDYVQLIVQDNGCGMTDEVKEHLFEPFFTRRRDGRGTGLGLPITSRIIADHGGRILPHSDGVGKGSRFEVLLPSKENVANHDRQLQVA